MDCSTLELALYGGVATIWLDRPAVLRMLQAVAR